jgi:hypothetical protein
LELMRERPNIARYYSYLHGWTFDPNPKAEVWEVWDRVVSWKWNFQPPRLQYRLRTATDWIIGRRRLVVNNARELTVQHGKVSVHLDEVSRGALLAF